jgi:hypothetical protein
MIRLISEYGISYTLGKNSVVPLIEPDGRRWVGLFVHKGLDVDEQ